ncbi:MAG: ABC transporter permease subunit [Deltaproteobacteria bacterium]|nr:ABC transporter permease subunit [Deltaproteobacteria bacterium]
MSGLLPLLRKELRELLRTYRALVVAVAFVIVGLGSPLAAKLTPRLLSSLASDPTGGVELVLTREPSTNDALFQYHKNLALLPVLVILLAMGSLSSERRRGTAQLVLTKPISRRAYLLAKLIAPGALYLAGIAVAGGGCLLYTWLLFGAVDVGGFILLNLLYLLALWFYLAVTVLASAALDSAIAAGGVGLAAFALCGLLGSFDRIGRYSPGGLFNAALALVRGTDRAGLVPSLVATALLIAVCAAIADRVLEHQEL